MLEDGFRFVDLFAGVGGMRIAAEANGGTCVFTSEIDKHCRKTYAANFTAESEIAGDIREVADEQVPDHDLMAAGFPCQPFSKSGVAKRNSMGRKHGFLCETQGTLFFEIARIVEAKRPKAVLLENVKHLVHHDGGRTLETVVGTLENMGYGVSWRLVNAAFAVPQARERIFLLALRDGAKFDLADVRFDGNHPRLGMALHPEDGSERPEWPFTEGPQARVRDRYYLSEKLWAYLQGYKDRHKAAGHGFGCTVAGPHDVSRTLSARYYKDGSECLIAPPAPGLPPRKLTPREAFRIMGFPDDFAIPVSPTQAWKQAGNALVPAVPDRIIRALTGSRSGLVAECGHPS